MEALQRVTSMKIKEFGEYGGVNPSIEVSTTFTVLDPATLDELFLGHTGPQHGCFLYGRSFNPTVRALGRHLAAMEGTEAAYACSSGMAAISSTLMALCNSGDHIVCSSTVYGGTFSLLKSFLPIKCNISTTFVNVNDVDAVTAAINDKTKVIYAEAQSNPTLVASDLPSLAKIAREKGLKLVVDNTFTPYVVSPVKHGADIVVHSMTKFMSGASDIIAGVVCGPARFIDDLMNLHTAGPFMLLGPTMDPKVASELLLRLPHLPVRMQEHSRRALYFAQGLEALGAKVVYPGLPSHPGHKTMASITNNGFGFGGVLGIEFESAELADVFMQRLQNKHGFGYIAVSLGYFDTLMCISASSTSSELSADQRAAAGIPSGYLRMSVGITGVVEQRWEQLRESYEFVKRVGTSSQYKAVKVKRHGEDHTAAPILWWHSEGPLSEKAEDDEEVEFCKLPAKRPRAV
ncbi:hypothetical protein CEUSTIGMA_g10933.t1 [Chlamydomonas eustigma]|uniref:Methionine gamma-lyase n=1 Tax=Chlamydomonas eustigma TaxID=1157962 RepID=A0A250XKB7_9CHLO|nr:hypothetical protein CEUSTIGMA_g10933.t1 [Chlamydomonas eustigma]|eukprot:GAX83508.1 hypothetical protein CEUSTIGMA_g10933.t1 [Chlamydomonas eustigma]